MITKGLIFFDQSGWKDISALSELFSTMEIAYETRPLTDGVGAIAAPDLIDAQACPFMMVAGSGQGAEILRSIGSTRGILVDGPLDQPRALLGRIGAMLDRPGLGGWLAARDAGPAHLVDWSKANPADPLARSAALGVDPVGFARLVTAASATAGQASNAPQGTRPTQGSAATTSPEIALVTPGDDTSATQTAAEGSWWRAALPYGAVAAAIGAVLISPAVLLADEMNATDRATLLIAQFFLAAAFFSAAVMPFRWAHLPREDADGQARFLYVARAALSCAVTTPLFFGAALLIDMMIEHETSFGMPALTGVLIVGAIAAVAGLVLGGMVAALALTLVRHLHISARAGIGLVGATVALLTLVTLVAETEKQTETALRANLKRVGLMQCDLETDMPAAIRVAERRLQLPETGKVSSTLRDKVDAMPDKAEWTLASEGVSDGTSLAEILPFMCSTERKKAPVLHVRRGQYEVDSDIPSSIQIIGEGKRDDTVFLVPAASSGVSVGSEVRLGNLTLRSQGRRESAILTIWGLDVALDNVAVVGDSKGGLVSLTSGGVEIRRSEIQNRSGLALDVSSGSAMERPASLEDVTLVGRKGGAVYSGENANLRIAKSRLAGQLAAFSTARVTVTDSEIEGAGDDYAPLYASDTAKITISGSSLSATKGSYCAWVEKQGVVEIRDSSIGRCQPRLSFAHAEKEGTLRISGSTGQRVTRSRIDVKGSPKLELNESDGETGRRDGSDGAEKVRLSTKDDTSLPPRRESGHDNGLVDYTE